MTAAKVELGRYLFYDKRMSVNGKTSCGSCHRQELAFTDGRAQAEGTTGERHPRSSMSLANVAYSPVLTWANPSLSSLEEQALIPILGTEPIELGLKGHEQEFLRRVSEDGVYRRLFPQAFPGEREMYTLKNVAKAIAAFERTIISMNSPYDRYRYGNQRDAISPAAKRGEVLFFTGKRTGCSRCHGSWNFDGAVRYEGGPEVHVVLQNTGLSAEDTRKFRAPTLRNIAVTGPYMHDGSLKTLGEVIEHYASGGQDNPSKALSIRGFKLTEGEKSDLIAFLESLTDREFLRNPRLGDPWKR